MREQILKKFTQIPDHLYIKRKADDQVRRNIEEMLRPGYVSVARQMGKTNLLQYAQRTLESTEQIIVYIDVTSSHYDDVRDYFQYIIDTVIESHYESFSHCSEEIQASRKNNNFSPAKEHQNELKFLLKIFSGKLIVILDEVDSLVRYDFSDQIFAQIRSIYFMKNTFKEFRRLSYLLSGVIEPNKIIKSKENSPFNIAQKLYLDDFTYQEFNLFIENAKLKFLDNDVIDRVYHWTNGNPRMTYDICAEIENKYINEGGVTVKNVDQIVEKLYLVRYDQAPIDHIRDLLLNNVLLRTAVQDIRRNKLVSDELKGQLYLYGVINSDFEKPVIKNLIVDKALSDDWIASIEIDNRGLYTYGLDCIINKQFTEAIQAFAKYIEDSGNASNVSFAKYYLGIAHKELKDYKLSNFYLIQEPIENEDKNKILFRGQFMILGNNFWLLNDDQNAKKYYEIAIKQNILDEEHYYSIFNLAAIYGRSGDLDMSLSTYRRLISELESNKNIPDETANKLTTSSYYSIGNLQRMAGQFLDASHSYDSALLFAQPKNKPSILIGRYTLPTNDYYKIDDIKTSINIILENKLIVEENESSATVLLSKEELRKLLLDAYITTETRSNFGNLLEYVSGEIDKVDKEEILIEISEKLVELDMSALSVDLLETIIKSKVNPDFTLKSLKYLIFINRQLKKPYMSLFSQYFTTLTENAESYKIDETDISVLTNTVFELWSRKDNKTALNYSKLIPKILENVNTDSKYYIALMLLISADTSYKLDNLFDAKMYAYECKNFTKSYRLVSVASKEDSDVLLSSIENKIEEIITLTTHNLNGNTPASNFIPIDHTKLGRNDLVRVKYMNGPLKEGKYKLFEIDVKRNFCIVVALV